MASDKANPKIAYVNNCLTCSGVREYALINAPKIIPIPIPVPAIEIVAKPLPINFAEFINIDIIVIILNNKRKGWI